jgi:UDP-N-acetylmuramate dehydrogenase
MPTLDRDWLVARFGERVRFEAPFADYTSFRIGGPVEILVLAKTPLDLSDAVARARSLAVPWLVIGRGSNILVDDAGIRGVVIRNETSAWSIDRESDVLVSDSGVRLPTLGAQTAKAGWRGLEFAVGIPGSVGGGVLMNAGAHGGSIADTLVSATVLVDGAVKVWEPAQLEHGYRNSALQRRRDVVVLGATFRLVTADASAALAQIKEFRAHRQETQPTDPGAGSIFRNPPGSSAGTLIDRTGLKGTRRGGAVISPKHANFTVNLGGATAADVRALIDLARETVFREYGILLHPEVEHIGPAGRMSLE